MNPKVILLLALVAISVGLYGLLEMRQQDYLYQEKIEPEPEHYRVWVLNRDISRAEVLTRKDVSATILSKKTASEKGIYKNVELDWGQRLIAVEDLYKGRLISPCLLTSPGEPEYFDTLAQPGLTPFNITVPEEEIVGGTIVVGDLVDISVLSTIDQNLASEQTVADIENLTMTPLLSQVPVLQMISKQRTISTLSDDTTTDITLVLHVTNQQIAKLSVAKRISKMIVHRSLGAEYFDELSASFGDVIQSTNSKTSSVKEYRFN